MSYSSIIAIYVPTEPKGHRRQFLQRQDQRVAYRIGNLSKADISDFFVYRIVYRIEPPISSISIFSKPMIFLSFFAENSKNSPKILKNSPKIQKTHEPKSSTTTTAPKIPKIRRKF